jgi:hypothetical protein
VASASRELVQASVKASPNHSRLIILGKAELTRGQYATASRRLKSADFLDPVGRRLFDKGAEQHVIPPPFPPQESGVGAGKANHA